MKSTDKEQLSTMLDAIYALYGKTVTPATVQLWASILEPYDMAQVTQALSQLMRTSAYLPKPSEVIDLIEPSQWPTPAEAWATYPIDESDTGAVCNETLAAWSSARDLYEAGDGVGARRAFEGAYQRAVDAAVAQGERCPTWRSSLGWDANKRERGALNAVQRGLLTQQDVERYLPHDETAQIERRSNGDDGRESGLLPVGRFIDRPDGRGAN